MTISFKCEHCHKEVQAPDSAGGKRGKCPCCGQASFIPAPVSAEDVLPLTPLSESEERKQQEEIDAQMAEQRALIAASAGGEVAVPLEHRDDVTAEDLYHLVVNYCIDLLESKLDRAQLHLEQLKKFPATARKAVDDIASGKVCEPALDRMSARVKKGFLLQLRDQLN